MGMINQMKTAALIVAAGQGVRTGGNVPKQYQIIVGKPVLTHVIETFLDHDGIDLIQVVIGKNHTALYNNAAGDFTILPPVAGGITRQASVKAGLDVLRAHDVDQVLIHDAARPFVGGQIISAVMARLVDANGAIPVQPVTDTIKYVDDDRVSSTPERARLRAAQTPQAFRFSDILKAHEKASASGIDSFTDDSSIAEWAGLDVVIVEGAPENKKLTISADFTKAESSMNHPSPALYDVRTGNGYDVHAFEPGDEVVLCGVAIPYAKKLKGHSDADVAMHSLADAILGALCEGDIGKHFPPSDPQWKGAASDIFLKKAVELVLARGGILSHCDITLVCEEPKIGPHVDAMRTSLGKIMDVETSRISVKATTSERLGFTGRGEGIAALATATIRLP
jgi:2-C-methyl-D-erythritol 4-phosphate cytidylyltransferase/2-C-methyl-D-erythritol 2,4-cyclodiphosphate synthase